MSMDGEYREFVSGGLSYDSERDGVWIHDEKAHKVIFLKRATIITALGLLPEDPPDDEVPF